MNTRRMIPLAVVAGAALAPAVAGAHGRSNDAPVGASGTPQCLKSDSADDRAIAYAVEGSTLKLTKRDANEVLRVKANHRRGLRITRDGDAYTFDLRGVEGETFAATKRKSADGKLRLRLVASSATGERLRAIEVRVKAYTVVDCKTKDSDD